MKRQPLTLLQQHFGKSAEYYYHIARGIDNRPLINHRIRKSVGVETTFAQDIKICEDVIECLQSLLEQALTKAAEKQLVAHTLTVKIKYHNFVLITRSRTLPTIVTLTSATREFLEDLLSNTDIGERTVRLLGITLSSLENKAINRYRQLDLFSDW